MEDTKKAVLEAIKAMQLANKAAKIFPTGVSCQEVFAHLECSISYKSVVDAMEHLVLDGAIKLYPTMHGKRALALDV